MRPIITIAIQSGMRRGEILRLKWSNVDFIRGTIYLPETKSGSPQTAAMNRVVKDELLALHMQAPASEYVFPNPDTGKPYTAITKAFTAVCQEAAIEGLHFHDLRATCATRLMHRGADPATIQSVLRHSDSKITLERYTRSIDERKRQALEKIADYAESELDCHRIVKIDERRSG
jgi:integrase